MACISTHFFLFHCVNIAHFIYLFIGWWHLGSFYLLTIMNNAFWLVWPERLSVWFQSSYVSGLWARSQLVAFPLKTKDQKSCISHKIHRLHSSSNRARRCSFCHIKHTLRVYTSLRRPIATPSSIQRGRHLVNAGSLNESQFCFSFFPWNSPTWIKNDNKSKWEEYSARTSCI